MSTSGCNFSFKHYGEILKAAVSSHYRFIAFDEIGKVKPDEKICILRHDIDYSPDKIPFFSEKEIELGIRATYFVQVAARPYNLREAENYKIIRELEKQGHRVGLHYDLAWNPELEFENLDKQCREDKEVFEKIMGVKPCDIISFHNPHKFGPKLLNAEIKGVHHSYEKRYFSDMKYLSDSQGWYEGCLCKIFEAGKYNRIQLLTHPYIWGHDHGNDFVKDMAELVNSRKKELVDYLVNNHPVCKKNEERFRKMTGAYLKTSFVARLR